MASKQNVIGQTGVCVLSVDAINRHLGKKRTVRYKYTKLQCGWIAWVCGPFHSRTYGACGYGTTKRRAKVSLEINLANNYGYLGCTLFSDVDEADNVGNIDERLVSNNIVVRPITTVGAGV